MANNATFQPKETYCILYKECEYNRDLVQHGLTLMSPPLPPRTAVLTLLYLVEYTCLTLVGNVLRGRSTSRML